MRSFSHSVLLSLLSLALLSTARPTPALSQSDLISNAKEAQTLNVQFQTLNASDPCNNGDSACIEGSIAQCDGTSWTLEKECPPPTNCFALPSVRRKGTFLVCTLQTIANGLVTDIGVEGGITGNSTDDDNSDSGSGATVTITVTLSDPTATPTVTLDSVTQTLDPSAAAAALGGLTAPPTITLNNPSVTPEPAPSPTLAGNLGGTTEAATTIFLNNPPQPTVAEPAASPSSSADSGYGGYGGY